jgi:hypothetical protein
MRARRWGPSIRTFQWIVALGCLAAVCGGANAPSSPTLELVAHLPLPAEGAKIWAHKNIVYIGGYYNAKVGVKLIDIADPAHPALIATLPRRVTSSAEYEDVMAISAETAAFKGDLLAVGYQGGRNGAELWDVTDPHQPRSLSFFSTSTWVHELYLLQREGRILLLLATWSGGLRIVDATDPTRPVLLSTWEIQKELKIRAAFGTWADTFNHSVSVSEDGTRAYVSYWDAGTVILDITDPSQPRYLGRATPEPGDEGNQRASMEADGGRLLLTTEADIDPKPISFLVRVHLPASLAGPYQAFELSITRPLSETGPVRGPLAYAGSGAPGTDLLADPKGKIALIDSSAPTDILRLQEAGAVAVLSSRLTAGSGQPASPITIPGTRISAETADALKAALAAGEPVEVELVPGVATWGVVRLWNIEDRAKPVQIGTFATPAARQYPPPGPGLFLATYAFVRGHRAYVSWLTDGVHVLDIADPAHPREIAHFVPPFVRGETRICSGGLACGAWPAVWEVVEHNGLILANDTQSGLWILRDPPR